MEFGDILEQTIALLQHQGRVSYVALKRRFGLDDAYLEDLKTELIEAQQLAHDENGRILVWTGQSAPAFPSVPGSMIYPTPTVLHNTFPDAARYTSNAERRQLSVMFCDLVGSTALSTQLDLEDWREVVRAYQATAAEVITRFEGYMAQYLGDGLLVYFGYPRAHEDDAQRAVRAGLEIIEALRPLNTRLEPDKGVRLAVRLGIHTGLVVVGEVGDGSRQEHLALGETPHVAARLQELAASDTVVISAVTARLVQSAFALEDLDPQRLQGVTEPIAAMRVRGLLDPQRAEEDTLRASGPLLVGRDEEVGLLRRWWEQSQDGRGQVVLINGEPGIGKTALVETLRVEVRLQGAVRLTFRCSPYHQHSVLYPVIEHLQRVFQFERDELPAARLMKLERSLAAYRFPLAETVPLFAALLSVPTPAGRHPVLNLSPEQQKQQTHDALAAWLAEETERQTVLAVWEDVQWADPSTLEVLGLAINQTPTMRMLTVLTFRPDFLPPWPIRSHMTPLTLHRLERPQVEAMVRHLAGGKTLPDEVLQQIVTKTDGVPLFVEELTKMVLESPLLRLVNGHYELCGPLPPLAIPVTLHDSLMARLDRLSEVREVVQLGAVLGREFAYDILARLTPLDAVTLQTRLTQLVAAELLYQRGRPPRARYVFKHALIQDAAYASMLKSTRQRAHQQIAQVYAQHAPELVETQPEVVAHHYTEAGLTAQAMPYWQQAGQRAVERSAHVEAIVHCTRGLELLPTLPETPERARQELALYMTLRVSLTATRGYGAPEVERAYTRARELCQQVGETSQLFSVLLGLAMLYLLRAEHQPARELGEQCLTLAQRANNSARLLRARSTLGVTLFWAGELTAARTHLEQSIALYDPQQPLAQAFVVDMRVSPLAHTAFILWLLGYPEQARQRNTEVLTLAQELLHPHSRAFALFFAATFHQLRREGPAARACAEAAMSLAAEQGFLLWLAGGTAWGGWALAALGHGEAGIVQLHQGIAAWQATGTALARPWLLALLAETYGTVGQPEAGLRVLSEALTVVDTTGERQYAAEIYRLTGELTLQQRQGTNATLPHSQAQAEAAACFHKALEVARQQSAKSLELRAAMSLSRLWQRQGRSEAARQLLAPIYGWFTEGFDTADLQEARALLETLGQM